MKYAKELGMVITGGSDTHSVDLFGGGTAFREKLKDIHDFAERIKNARAEDYVATDGMDLYDACGGKL